MEAGKLISGLAKQYLEEIIRIRRHLHRYPELSMQEHNTASFITDLLSDWGIPFRSGIAGTGIVALIQGEKGQGKTIALRADMDALPIQEENEAEYRSLNPGVMHACGHDAHMASLLGCMKILNQIKHSFCGEVRCIFQPSEEKFPGGASLMIQEGVLENPPPSAIFGQHTLPSLEAGKIGMKAGKYMASTDEIYLTVRGVGGHAATPELLVDPVLIAAHILVALQQIVSRHARSDIPSVLSFGHLEAAGRTNIIPSEVKISGTFRTFDEQWREKAHTRITRMAESIAGGMGGSCEVHIEKGYPFLVNDEELTGRAIRFAREYLGEDKVVLLDMRMTAEDFAYYAQLVPACFYRLGTADVSRGITSNLHTPSFDIDEKALETGMGLMAWLAYCELCSD
ncbi:MAG TPA: M20 family metallopeptidase [Bacteroidales bacterium]|nr:M20 family metallopeptidase [Bacteroidales bacterium]HSA42970.1 M20 family metallopeptidase [Bacteroidales bacterium]